MQQVIINVGVSGSGKTTWTSKFIKENPNWLRINRDDIRKTLVGSLDGYYQRKDLNELEYTITRLEENIFNKFINKNYNLIIDNTHLKQEYIKRWIDTVSFINTIQAKTSEEILIKFKIFDIKDNIMGINVNWLYKQRIAQRDSFTKPEQTNYIDKQLQQFKNIVEYINKEHQNKIIENE